MNCTIVLIQRHFFICMTLVKWVISVLLLSFLLPKSSTSTADSTDVIAVVSHIFASL